MKHWIKVLKRLFSERTSKALMDWIITKSSSSPNIFNRAGNANSRKKCHLLCHRRSWKYKFPSRCTKALFLDSVGLICVVRCMDLTEQTNQTVQLCRLLLFWHKARFWKLERWRGLFIEEPDKRDPWFRWQSAGYATGGCCITHSSATFQR